KNIILNKRKAASARRTATPPVRKLEKIQSQPVRGKVVAKDGVSLPGVTVLEKGTQNSTMTDDNGIYRLNVRNAQSILVFTTIGYEKQEKTVGQQEVIDLILQESVSEMDEVVIVGYGEQKKVNLTGAISEISGEEFEDRPVAQLTQALQGQVPNLNVVFGSGQPGTSGTVNIRGNTSINGGGPLILIDGILGTLDRINVNDVESVTVLKDASAAAVYGARGAFGVILVTTKKGKVDGKASIDYISEEHTSN